MTRQATPLVVAPALACTNRLEILIAEARLRNTPIGVENSEDPLLTVLLTFDPTELDRRSARSLAATFVAADCSFAQAPSAANLGAWAAQRLHQLPASDICMVVALPDYSPDIEQQLALAVASIREGCHRLSVIVGVATTPADWACCDLDGFIVVEHDRRVADALRVFMMLSAVMAPSVVPCLDADDFRCALGTADSPSRLAEAVYLVGSTSFMPVHRVDQEIMENAAGVALMASKHLRLSTQARLVRRVRARVKPDAALTLVGPLGWTVEPLGFHNWAHVLLLCRPD